MSFVYWIYDESCKNILTDGYIGVAEDLGIRLNGHMRKTQNIMNKYVQIKPIYEGTREECFLKERELRPKPGIGWNRAIGGSHGWREGFTHSEEALFKMKNAWTDERREKLVIANKKNAINKKGKVAKQLYVIGKCDHCRIEATQSNITKWHNDNCKMNPNNHDNDIGFFEYIACPHCEKRFNTAKPNSRRNFKVYHLDNCKHKRASE